MQPFRRLVGRACPLPVANIDTDQLIPARFMKRSREEGYGRYLLHDMRFNPDGTADPTFPLNQPPFANARIIVALRNFGAGSSREAAVYALVDFGIRCVVAPSFGDIFASNAVNNGLVPAKVSQTGAEALLGAVRDGAQELTVDLEEQSVAVGDLMVPFEIDLVWRMKLLNGWDDFDLTLSQAEQIAAFAEADQAKRPWATPSKS